MLQQPQKPNVVFILADTVDYGDLGPCGGGSWGAPTPQFLVEPACTPSRAAKLAGIA
jgi:arylsulfatase